MSIVDFMLDFIHLVYSPRRIHSRSISNQCHPSWFTFLLQLYKSHKCGYATAITNFIISGIMPSHIELEIYLKNYFKSDNDFSSCLTIPSALKYLPKSSTASESSYTEIKSWLDHPKYS